MPRILLVEDNELNREMLSRRLARKGFEVLIAVDGLQGVAMTQAEHPDLVLMDLSLPGIDGWEATRRLKADAATQAIPVIALTAHAMADDRAKALAAGCNEFDTKPVDLARLLAKMADLLPTIAQTDSANLANPSNPAPAINPATLPQANPSGTRALAQLTLPAVAASLPAFKTELEHFCMQAGVAAAVHQDLQVALDELCANVFAHAYPAGQPGALAMHLSLLPTALEMTLSDQGQPFNPLAKAPPDLSLAWDQRPIGGLGVHLVQRLTDHQHYRHSATEGNQLTLVKNLP
jgi:CheY-like chemotaxis protein